VVVDLFDSTTQATDLEGRHERPLSPTTLTRTSRTWTRAWSKCSRTFLQALRRSNGCDDDSPTLRRLLSSPRYGGHSIACGGRAARGTGQHQSGGLDQRRSPKAPRSWPHLHRGTDKRSDPKGSTPPQPFVKTQDPAWYAEQAARLRDELERRKAQLDDYRQSIEEATSLKTAAGGINLDEGDIGITPQAGIEILQQRLSEAQSQLDTLEDMARRNGIEPGTLRGQ